VNDVGEGYPSDEMNITTALSPFEADDFNNGFILIVILLIWVIVMVILIYYMQKRKFKKT
jgi:hypothetical protein